MIHAEVGQDSLKKPFHYASNLSAITNEGKLQVTSWGNFFLGELGASAALAGLLFVSVSFNQSRILALGRIADRGFEALAMLFLVLVIAPLGLVPGHPSRIFGGEVAGIAGIMLVLLIPVQQGYLRDLDTEHRPLSLAMVQINRLAIATIALAGLILAWRGDQMGLYVLVPGILLSFLAAGANAWVLLVEINRYSSRVREFLILTTLQCIARITEGRMDRVHLGERSWVLAAPFAGMCARASDTLPVTRRILPQPRRPLIL